VANGSEKRTGRKGQRQVVLSERRVAAALRQHALLRGLMVTGAGYCPSAAGQLRHLPKDSSLVMLVYCIKGGGWYKRDGQFHPIRAGDLLVVLPGRPHEFGAHGSKPWTVYWVHLAGSQVRDYLKELGVSTQAPVVRIGNDLQLSLLFHEVVRAMERGFLFLNLLLASHALAHLVALMVRHRHEGRHNESDGVQRIAQSIIYMSEHLDQPLRISSLAELVQLSPAHYTVLFKEQAGCSPLHYLLLLRIHQACQLLQLTTLTVKGIAARLGYKDPFHFSRQFKQHQGVSPSEYRAS
jgi:AraC family transcriptional regulator, arabinose operon regulatory protein